MLFLELPIIDSSRKLSYFRAVLNASRVLPNASRVVPNELLVVITKRAKNHVLAVIYRNLSINAIS